MNEPPKPKVVKRDLDKDIERAADGLLALLIRKNPERAKLILSRIKAGPTEPPKEIAVEP